MAVSVVFLCRRVVGATQSGAFKTKCIFSKPQDHPSVFKDSTVAVAEAEAEAESVAVAVAVVFLYGQVVGATERSS